MTHWKLGCILYLSHVANTRFYHKLSGFKHTGVLSVSVGQEFRHSLSVSSATILVSMEAPWERILLSCSLRLLEGVTSSHLEDWGLPFVTDCQPEAALRSRLPAVLYLQMLGLPNMASCFLQASKGERETLQDGATLLWDRIIQAPWQKSVG